MLLALLEFSFVDKKSTVSFTLKRTNQWSFSSMDKNLAIYITLNNKNSLNNIMRVI